MKELLLKTIQNTLKGNIPCSVSVMLFLNAHNAALEFMNSNHDLPANVDFNLLIPYILIDIIWYYDIELYVQENSPSASRIASERALLVELGKNISVSGTSYFSNHKLIVRVCRI